MKSLGIIWMAGVVFGTGCAAATEEAGPTEHVEAAAPAGTTSAAPVPDAPGDKPSEEPMGDYGPWYCAKVAGAGHRYRVVVPPTDRAEIAHHVRVVPYFEKPGQLIGYKLYNVTPGPTACGFESGDVITHFNGERLETPDTALLSYRRAKEEGVLRVATLRNGEKIEVEIELE